MSLSYPYVCLLLCLSLSLPAQEPPFRLGRVDLTPAETYGREHAYAAPLGNGEGQIIFSNEEERAYLYFTDGATVTEIPLPGPVAQINDLTALGQGRLIWSASCDGATRQLYYVSPSREISVIGEPYAGRIGRHTVLENFIYLAIVPQFNDPDPEAETFHLTVNTATRSLTRLPITSPQINRDRVWRSYRGHLVVNTQDALYLTDGTASGTRLLLNEAVNTSLRVDTFTGSLFLTEGTHLYRLDEPTGELAQLTDETFPDDLRPTAIEQLMTTEGGVVYLASTSTHGRELFLTDGTATGSQLFREFVPGPADGVRWIDNIDNDKLAFSGVGVLDFVVEKPGQPLELWVTDGSPSGTILLNQDAGDADLAGFFKPLHLTENRELFFTFTSSFSTGGERQIVYGLRLDDEVLAPTKVLDVPDAQAVTPFFVNSAGGWTFLYALDKSNGLRPVAKAVFRVNEAEVVFPPDSDFFVDENKGLFPVSTGILIGGFEASKVSRPYFFSYAEQTLRPLTEAGPLDERRNNASYFFSNGAPYVLARNRATGFGIYAVNESFSGATFTADLHPRGATTNPPFLMAVADELFTADAADYPGFLDPVGDSLRLFPSELRFSGLDTAAAGKVAGYAALAQGVPPYRTFTFFNGVDHFTLNRQVNELEELSLPVAWEDRFAFLNVRAAGNEGFAHELVLVDPVSQRVEKTEIDDFTRRPFSSVQPEVFVLDGDLYLKTAWNSQRADLLLWLSPDEGLSLINDHPTGTFQDTEFVPGLNEDLVAFRGIDDDSLTLILLHGPVNTIVQYDRTLAPDEVPRGSVNLPDGPLVMTSHRLSRGRSAVIPVRDPNRVLLAAGQTSARLSHLSPGKTPTHFYFVRQHEETKEIWETDGTATGTRQLATFTGEILNPANYPFPVLPGYLAISIRASNGSQALLVYSMAENEFYTLQTDPSGCEDAGIATARDNRFYFLYTDPLYGREVHYLDFGARFATPGLVFHDRNGNGEPDAGEESVNQQPIRIRQNEFRGTTTYSGTDGTYRVAFFPDSAYSLTINPTSCWEPAAGTETVNLTATEPLTAPNFPLRLLPGTDSVTISLTSAPIRCGFTVPFWLSITNDGCQPLTDVAITTSLPPEVWFESADLPPTRNADNELSWGLDTLPLGATWSNLLYLTMPNEEFFGQEIPFDVTVQAIQPVGNTEISTIFHYEPILRCAIDPNDKLVQPARTENNYTQIDETLTYTIRFQNTGNDTAFNVRLEDQLSPDLDLKTFQPLAASHPHRVELADDGLLQVFFDNILLPDSNVNYPASNGFFSFTIALDGTALDQEVPNTAGIYFDFNAPVITNTVTSTVVEFLDEDTDGFFFWRDCNDRDSTINPNAFDVGGNGIDENCDGNDWTTAVRDPLPGSLQLFPNPTSGWLELRYSLPDRLLVEVFDGRGRRMRSGELRSQGRLDLSGLPPAVYQVKFTNQRTGRFAGRRILVAP